MNTLQRLAAKALGIAFLPRSGVFAYNRYSVMSDDWGDYVFQSPTDKDYAEALVNAHKSSLVSGCIDYTLANATSTPLVVVDDGGEELDQHPILDVLRRPTPHTDWTTLMSGFIQSLALDGNAYALRVGSRAGDLRELQYIPHTAVTVESDTRGQLSHYLYRVDGREIRIRPRDIVHIRRWQDWRRPHYGVAPIAALGPEIWMDMEATRMISAIMKNRGMPGGILAPERTSEETQLLPSPEDLRATRDYMRTEYTGDKRGNWMVFGEPMKATPLAFDPRLLDLSSAYNHAEERICAAFGYPAVVIGFGAGINQSRVGAATREFERQAWQGGIVPLQELIARQLTQQLLGIDAGVRLGFDRSEVPVLQKDENDLAKRWTEAVTGGWATIAEAREAHALDVLDTDRVYLRPVNVMEVPAGARQLDAETEAAEAAQAVLPDPEPETENGPPGNGPPQNGPPGGNR